MKKVVDKRVVDVKRPFITRQFRSNKIRSKQDSIKELSMKRVVDENSCRRNLLSIIYSPEVKFVGQATKYLDCLGRLKVASAVAAAGVLSEKT